MEQDVAQRLMEGVHPDDVQGCFDGLLGAPSTFDARMSEIHDGSSAKAHSVLKRLQCEDVSSWFSCLFRV
jgi:inosine/xanthosine triphosphate pyrophosphatase family protein